MNSDRLAIKSSQNGFTHRTFLIVLAIIFIGAAFLKPDVHAASSSSPRIVSGISGYCLDDHTNSLKTDNTIDIWKCNNTASQTWEIKPGNIVFDSTYCLSVENDKSLPNTPIVLNKCNNTPGQIWLDDQTGYFNPNSQQCLTAPTNSSGQLFISACNKLSSPQQTWTAKSIDGKTLTGNLNCSGSKGNVIACEAEKEWTNWQSGELSHNTLLTAYTDGASYEEWCADFVSYIYKEAGYPFTQGESDGWDESNANNIQNMGFTEHSANSGYIPKPGDVAYFNYENGHVEIVVSGGKNPTFIYGNSGTIDPTTGNGEMEANTIIKDSSEGQLIYYLTPN